MQNVKKIDSRYGLFSLIVLMYFIPKYIEFTTLINVGNVKNVVFIIKNMSYIFALGYIGILIIKKRIFRFRYAIVILFAFLYFLGAAIINGRNNVFIVLLFSLIFEEKYLKKYIRLIFNTSCLLYLFTIVASCLGLIKNVITIRYKFGEIWEAGSYGFEYSGQMIMLLIPIVFMYYYLNQTHVNFFHSAIWITITMLVYSGCQTIMGAVLIILFILLFHISKAHKKGLSGKILKSEFLRFTPFVCCIISYLLIKIYASSGSFGILLDIIVNGRLSTSVRVIEKYGISLLGTEFVNNTLEGKYEIIDSEYIHMIVGEGLLYLFFTLIICYYILRWSQNKKDMCLTLIWIMIFLNAIFNNGIFGLVMNPFSILLVLAIKEKFIKYRSP